MYLYHKICSLDFYEYDSIQFQALHHYVFGQQQQVITNVFHKK